MNKVHRIAIVAAILGLLLLASPVMVASKVGPDALKDCRELAFSTEEDFVTQGPEPVDGNPIISDGDLLGLTRDASGAVRCVVCARNADLTEGFDIPAAVDLGLDAADVLDVDAYLVAFSTELASSTAGQFSGGDLLITDGTIIPNQALTYKWGVSHDVGLDAIHFVGPADGISRFLAAASNMTRAGFLDPLDTLAGMLETYNIDIWFSTEGTWTSIDPAGFLDGDLLSARTGLIVALNKDLLPADVPAGITDRGVDFGLDAVTADRSMDSQRIHFSTEILFEGDRLSFTDGDVLLQGNGVVATNWDLVGCFQPKARELGLDALSVAAPTEQPCVSRIDRIGGIDIADIDPVDGTVLPGVVGINAPMPFGGQIDFQGNICPDVDQFRILYRKAASADPWQPVSVLSSKNWTVAVDAFIPPWPDCDGDQSWASDSNGWFDGPDYRALSDMVYGCNPDLALTVWESTAAVAGKDELYDVLLETLAGTSVISDTVRRVQLDNTAPVVQLDMTPGTCNAFTQDDMPITVSARISDTYFYRSQLRIFGDGYGTHAYPLVAFYDSATDNLIETGTVMWNSYVDVGTVSVLDLAANPVKCGYAVTLTAWDRARICYFSYPHNVDSHCNGCRYDGEGWTFEYTP
ncbi:MAG: hypothetical protein ACK2VD_00830 [Anaerolineae bacterium]|jgi:hypothetical protein